MSNMSIYEILGKFANTKYDKRHDGQFGIEIETESLEEYSVPSMKFWRVDRDNSLRHFGIEYILKSPMTHKDVPIALKEFKDLSQKIKFIPDSHSTSVHVHINFLNESFLTMANFFTTWSLIENIMIKFSGPDRLSNLFCLPIKDAEGTLDSLKQILTCVESKAFKRMSVSVDSVKYGAINPGPFLNFGSIEIRCFRGEMNTDIQMQWVDILHRLVEFCRTSSLTPPKICDMYKANGSRILDLIFGDLASVVKQRMSPVELNDLMGSNIRYAARLASTSNRWEKFGVFVQKKVYKEHLKAELDALAAKMSSGSSFDTLSYHMQLVVKEAYEISNPTTRVVDTIEDM
jgi:hypothetical protein